MKANLEENILKDCEIPPMPQVSAKITDMLSNEDVTAAQLTEVISMDSALATRVLNMANSSFYRRLAEISELRSAVVVLGLGTIKSLVLGASLKQLYKTSSLFENMLWQHSIASAMAATMLAKEIKYPHPDEVLVAGLLHDVGKNILNNSMPEKYQQVIESCYMDSRPYHEVESETFGFAHHHVGPLLVKHWNFPMHLGKAVYYHHEMEEVGNMEDGHKKLVALVNIANLFCRKLGLGYRDADETIDILASPAVIILGLELNEDNLPSYEERIVETFTKEKGYFE